MHGQLNVKKGVTVFDILLLYLFAVIYRDAYGVLCGLQYNQA